MKNIAGHSWLRNFNPLLVKKKKRKEEFYPPKVRIDAWILKTKGKKLTNMEPPLLSGTRQRQVNKSEHALAIYHHCLHIINVRPCGRVLSLYRPLPRAISEGGERAEFKQSPRRRGRAFPQAVTGVAVVVPALEKAPTSLGAQIMA